MKGKLCWLACGCVAVAASGFGQEFGSFGLGYAWQNTNGNKDAFASQYDLSQGAFVETLSLDLHRYLTGYERFDFKADGFGGDPHQHAAFNVVGRNRAWTLKLDYTRREAVFPSPALDLTGQSGLPTPSGSLANGGTFTITRWTGSLTWDAWNAARLRLDLRDVQRSGDRLFAYYGLGTPYLTKTSLDERTQELGLSLETRTLPVKLVFEQDIAKYTREPRGGVGNNGQPLTGTDPDLLATYATPDKDSSTVPTTRLAAVYSDGRFELVGQGLYRRDRLDINRNDTAAYAVGGQAGQISYLDAVMGSADTDTKLGDLRLGFAVADGLTLRVKGHYADVSTDTSLIGQRVLQLAGPGGTLDFPLAIDDAGYLNSTDKDVAGEAEVKTGPFGLVVGYHDGSREVAFQHGDGYTPAAVTRDAKGWNATASLALGRTFTAQVGWDDSSFEKYVFRTDPETVKRLWGRISARPVAGVELAAHGSHETLDNPATVADVSRPTDTVGVSATVSGAGGAFVSLSVDSLKLTADAAIIYYAPNLTSGTSHYDTDLLTTSLRGGVPLGTAVHLSGGALYVKDRGDSLPFTSKAFDLEVEVPGPFKTNLALFGNYWKYDIASTQNYDTTRYGISVRRRF
ncbi:MAG TPA: hypothetical protein VMT19_03050 [Thermoanaerobaculaceae bacterium]|nr:hypothetical protein [Thermoanaerobaculaceae bacterium]